MLKPTVFDSPTQLHNAVAEYCVRAYEETVAHQTSFHIALSGGTTPKQLYKLLAESPYVDKFDWSRVNIYFGDERYVAHTDKDSNYLMASDALLHKVPLPAENIHAIPTNLTDPKIAAENYQTTLEKHLPKNSENTPQFDLVLLGLGPDGHTASLFPDTEILHQQNKYCDAVYVKKFDSWRISITFPIINNSQRILLLSEGAAKADIIHELVNSNTQQYPVQMINAEHQMDWYVDKAAAQRL